MDKVFWLISVPKKKNDTFTIQQQKTQKEKELALNFKFEIPANLRVGTLDMLMALSDDLQRHDNFSENIVKKIVKQLEDLLDDGESVERILSVDGANVDTYVRQFKWEEGKYSTKKSMRELVDAIIQEIGKLDEELREKSVEYNAICHSLAASDRKLAGNLLSRGLNDLVKEEDFIETEYLTTLMVVVPKFMKKEWDTCYEKLDQFVLPRSSKLIFEDAEYALVSVTLFKRAVENFKKEARDKRFTVRDFKFDTASAKTDKEEKKRLESEKDSKKKKLLLWCKTNFSEGFIAWIHLKAIRLFVESVLRYGLPANFETSILMLHKRSNEKKLREVLGELYKDLGSAMMLGDVGDADAGVGHGASDKFYPYVFLTLNVEFSKEK